MDRETELREEADREQLDLLVQPASETEIEKLTLIAKAIFLNDTMKCEYTNYQGKKSVRYFFPLSIVFGSDNWHKEDQFLIHVQDLDRDVRRSFALKHMENFQ